MKKLFLTICLVVVFSNSALAACNGGTVVGRFCISNNDELNWWSAYNWCKADERHLPTIYEVCSAFDGGHACGLVPFEVGEKRLFWTATAYSDDSAYGV